MIRTHRPRGYRWNCASVFQQTPLFRYISYEDALADADEPLLPDQDDAFAPAERAAKRRRVEELADDFLNGRPLEIMSARLEPQAVKNAISCSFARPKDAHRALTEAEADAHLDPPTEAVWEDVEDNGEVLRSYGASRQVHDRDSTTVANRMRRASAMQTVFEEVHAQSSCRRRRSQQPGRIPIGPSTDALRQAAELRARKLHKIPSPCIQESQSRSCPRRVVQEGDAGPHSSTETWEESISDCGPSPTPAWTSSKWLRTRSFQPRHKGVTEDCSRDELAISSFSIPSQPPCPLAAAATSTEGSKGSPSTSPATALNPPMTGRSEGEQSASSTGDQDGDVPVEAPADTVVPQSTEDDVQSENALEQTPLEGNIISVQAEQTRMSDSQDARLARQGNPAVPQRSCITVNQRSRNKAVIPGRSENTPTDVVPVSSMFTTTVQASKNRPTGKPKTGRSMKSAGSTPLLAVEEANRRRSAPPEPPQAADPLADVPAGRSLRVRMHHYTESVKGKNSSPFVFRKRATRSGNIDDLDAGMKPPQMPPPPPPPPKSTKTPRKRMNSLTIDTDETTKILDTPLINEHLNQRLPQIPTSGARSSSLRKSLRAEMEALGAEMSRVEGDASSQLEPSSAERDEEVSMHGDNGGSLPSPVSQLAADTQAPWLGTQAMFVQAQRDLFASPDKTDPDVCASRKSTPKAQMTAARRGRRSLHRLSHDKAPMPSTQAMLDDWNGWSSIKKPRSAGKQSSHVPSPTISRGGMRTSMLSSAPGESCKDKARRMSSLRSSTSCGEESPAVNPPRTTSPTSAPPASVLPQTISKPCSAPYVPKPSGKIASSLSFRLGMSSVNSAPPAGPDTSFPPRRESQPSLDALGDRSFPAGMQSGQDSLSFGPVNVPPPPGMSSVRSMKVTSPSAFATMSISRLSFGPPDGLGDTTPDHLRNNAQDPNAGLSEWDSQELDATVTALSASVLGSASF